VSLQVLLDSNIRRQLKALHKAGGRSAFVANHAESVMERFALAGEADFKKTARRTRHGETRIKKCIKFDLVDGYRLLGIRKECDLLFLYIGTHDECDRWIRNKKGLRSILQKEDCDAVSVRKPVPEAQPEEEEPEPDTICEEYLTADLDEKVLRKVFRGLTGR